MVLNMLMNCLTTQTRIVWGHRRHTSRGEGSQPRKTSCGAGEEAPPDGGDSWEENSWRKGALRNAQYWRPADALLLNWSGHCNCAVAFQMDKNHGTGEGHFAPRDCITSLPTWWLIINTGDGRRLQNEWRLSTGMGQDSRLFYSTVKMALIICNCSNLNHVPWTNDTDTLAQSKHATLP